MISYREELNKLFDLQKFGMKFGLDGLNKMLDKLGNPQEGRKFIHLAGTNGKGSIGSMLQAVFSEAGLKTGLYTSPHLVTFRERIKVGECLISEEEVLSTAGRVWKACDPGSPPTFFEFVTAMAFLHFKDQDVELAIIETGLGGRLDSTNVIDPMLSVISNISLEHMEQLGGTLEMIAGEKAGIIKPGKPVITGETQSPALDVILRKAAELQSPAFVLGRDFFVEALTYDDFGRPVLNFEMEGRRINNLPLGLAGPHQAQNAALVLAALAKLADSGFPVTEEAIRSGMLKAVWPGRAETFPPGRWPRPGSRSAAPLLLDGAHNPAGALALAAMLDKMKFKRLHLIVGVMADKDIGGVLGPLLARADRLYLTRPKFSRAASPELLLEKLTAAFGTLKQVFTLHGTIPEALEAASAEAGAEDLAVLSGSLFTVGETRAYLDGINEVESN